MREASVADDASFAGDAAVVAIAACEEQPSIPQEPPCGGQTPWKEVEQPSSGA